MRRPPNVFTFPEAAYFERALAEHLDIIPYYYRQAEISAQTMASEIHDAAPLLEKGELAAYVTTPDFQYLYTSLLWTLADWLLVSNTGQADAVALFTTRKTAMETFLK